LSGKRHLHQLDQPGAHGLDALLLALDQLLAIEDSDAIIRRAVELARDRIGLLRVSIYVIDRCRHLMLGTWGSDSTGAIVDEHHVMYAMSSLDRAAVRPDMEGAAYTVFKGCLIVEQRSRQMQVASPGWVTCTPIGCGEHVIGLMLNDAGSSYAAFDEETQAKAAILCSALGAALRSLARATNAGTARLPVHRHVMAAVAMLAQDPGVDVSDIAQQLAVSPRSLTRLFEATLGVSLGQYRNRLRLDRVALLIAKGGTTLPDAAVAAGFASYAQFERVSRMFRWMALFRRRRTPIRATGSSSSFDWARARARAT
jgi:AraC-like DNA-binding protein